MSCTLFLVSGKDPGWCFFFFFTLHESWLTQALCLFGVYYYGGLVCVEGVCFRDL